MTDLTFNTARPLDAVLPPADATVVRDWETEDDGTLARHFVGTEWFTAAGVSIHSSGFQRQDGSVYGRDVVFAGLEQTMGGALTAMEAVELGRMLIALGHELRQIPGEARGNVLEGVA